jgi:hypothetical protein
MKKLLFSTLLILISFACFYFSPPAQKTTITLTSPDAAGAQRTETLESERRGITKFLEWIGIGALVVAAWLWRKELGVTQLGPLGGAEPPVSQQPAGTPPKSTEESEPPPSIDLAAISREMIDRSTQQQLEQIMQMFRKTHSVNASYVAHELRVTLLTARTLLYLLTKTGQVRADGFPKNTIYTPAYSLENRVLDAAKQTLSKAHGILSERRYVRVKRMYEVDSLIECEGITFIVEAKVLRTNDLLFHLNNWILQLLKVAKEFHLDNVACVLAIACVGGSDATRVQRQVDAFTFDSGRVPVQIMVFSEAELER